MRLFIIFLITITILSSSQINKKIERSKKTLESAEAQKRATNLQLSKIAKSIAQTEREYANIEKILDILDKEKRKNEQLYVSTKNRVDNLDKNISIVTNKIHTRFNKFLEILTNQFAIIAASKQIHQKSKKSVVLEEIYETYKKENDKKLAELKREITLYRLKKIRMSNERNNLKQTILTIEKKRELYKRKKREKVKLLKKLTKEEMIYKKKLKRLITRQNLLRLTLAKLNILRKQEIAEAKRREKERQAELERRARELEKKRRERERKRQEALSKGEKVDYTPASLKVKQYGGSYHKNSITSYRGRKTISPIKGARVIKKFGTYIDPIYKIKIFNESITLKAPIKDAKVRSVLNGKVVYVAQNSMLGKLVIISHANRLHTVYAGLSKISPLIKNGVKVRKGAVIGKVKSKLIFEATKNSKYINPLKLINVH